MNEERCGRCRFFRGYGADLDAPETGGMCKRFPPVLFKQTAHTALSAWMEDEISDMWRWPEVCADDWCGEFVSAKRHGKCAKFITR